MSDLLIHALIMVLGVVIAGFSQLLLKSAALMGIIVILAGILIFFLK